MDKPVLPDYSGACISNIVPALLDGAVDPPPWLPDAALDAAQVVLLVLDGLGWEQLQDRTDVAPVLSSLVGGPITSVTPSTTASTDPVARAATTGRPAAAASSATPGSPSRYDGSATMSRSA